MVKILSNYYYLQRKRIRTIMRKRNNAKISNFLFKLEIKYKLKFFLFNKIGFAS